MDDCPKKERCWCEKVKRTVPVMFCTLICRGNWQKFQQEDIVAIRNSRLPITYEQKKDDRLVSVCIPCRQEDVQYLERTIDSLFDNAFGPIEILVWLDSAKGYIAHRNNVEVFASAEVVGQRKIMNELARKASGVFLYRLDAHCAMSPEWDIRMKTSCGENMVVITIYDHLDPETWEGEGRDSAFWMIGADMKVKVVRPWKPLKLRKPEEEVMAQPGGSWMIRKDYYQSLGGSDESLGGMGAIGSEWSLKVWLTGGRMIIRTDVVCCHLFRGAVPFAYDPVMKKTAFEKLRRAWVLGEDKRRTKPMEWLLYKFNDYIKGRPTARRIKNANM